jgi:hypothetical protein
VDKHFVVTQIINAVIVILTTVITLRVTRPQKEGKESRRAKDYAVIAVALIAVGLIVWRLIQLSANGSVPLIAEYSALLVAYGLFLIAKVGRALR